MVEVAMMTRSSFGEHSIDSGLGEQTDNDDNVFTKREGFPVRRYQSMGQADSMRCHLDVQTIENEAVRTQEEVDYLLSTQTMRRRRSESAGMSMMARDRRARDSIRSYRPRAPPDSHWGQMFDAMMARYRDSTRDIAHICSADCSNCVMSDSLVQSELDSRSCEQRSGDAVASAQPLGTPTMIEPQVDCVTLEECQSLEGVATVARFVSPAATNNRMPRSLTENLHNRSKTTKAILRSISFHRPDIAMYNQPLNALRRTDSDNDVWIPLAPKVEKISEQKSKGQKKKSSADRPKQTTWQKFTKIFPFLNHKSSKVQLK